MITDDDIYLIHEAMVVAQQGEGAVNPNPLVGALIVRDDDVIASGYHMKYGDLHAERMAFKDADEKGVDCAGATMYVTLEPCCHQGNQPPCTEAIIERKIARVVVGLMDPNPLVAGKGIAQLREAGIEVDTLESEPKAAQVVEQLKIQNRVFLKYITTGMPWVTLKWAMTLDGKIASHVGDSKWVTGEKARERVHQVRHNNMAIMTGIGTVLADDPMLNVRLDDAWRQPVRIVLDRRARIPMESQLVRTANEQPLIVVFAEGADGEKLEELQEAGVVLWEYDNVEELMQRIGAEKIDSVLVESGGTLSESLLMKGLVDEVMAFVAPKIIGGKTAKTPVEGEGIELMNEAIKLKNRIVEQIGEDILISGLCSRE